MSESDVSFDTTNSITTDIETQLVGDRWNVFRILTLKSFLTLRRLWPWVFGLYVGTLTLAMMSFAILRIHFPFKDSGSTTEIVDLEINRDWMLSGTPADGVVFIGFAPRFALLEALMEEVERILYRNGLPLGVREFQVVPFNSEYSMDEFIRVHPGVLQYAFAFSLPGMTYPKLRPVLDIISYIHDKGPCHNKSYPPCPGDLYIAKVIMEAFINAHSRKENNMTLTYRVVKETHRRLDPILQESSVDIIILIHSTFIVVLTLSVIYVLAKERERIELTLKRMCIPLALNYAANLVVLLPLIILLECELGWALSFPYFGNVPILNNSDITFRLFFYTIGAASLASYCVLSSVLFRKAKDCVVCTGLLSCVFVYMSKWWEPPNLFVLFPFVNVISAQRVVRMVVYLEKIGGFRWSNMHIISKLMTNVPTPTMRATQFVVSVPVQLFIAALVVILRRRWNHLQFKSLKWTFSPRPEADVTFEQNMANSEVLPNDIVPRIVFNHVCTRGNVRSVALQDINWVIGRGEVSVAMGLENSGKSSIPALLYGDITSVMGETIAFNLDCATNRKRVLRNIGMNHHKTNNLFMQLTVRDNFWIFSKTIAFIFDFLILAQLRQHWQKKKGKDIDELIEDAGLKEVLDVKLSKLRQDVLVVLNVALAYVGDSMLIVLENPTKNLDINKRMRVWNFIKTHSKSRTVLITTNCIAEAQMIGDRITIFVDGHIHCSGTVPFVKEVVGTGYFLEIESENKTYIDPIISVCESFCEDCVVFEESQRKIVIFLSSNCEETGDLERLLDHLEQTQHELGIVSYDLQGATLEDAFIGLTSGTATSKTSLMNVDKKPTVLSYRVQAFTNIDNSSKASSDVSKPVSTTSQNKDENEPKSFTANGKDGHTVNASRSDIKAIHEARSDFHDLNDNVEGICLPLARHEGFKLFLTRLWVLLDYQFLIKCRSIGVEALQVLAIIVLVIFYKFPENKDWHVGEKVLDRRGMHRDFCPSLEIISFEGGTQALTEDTQKDHLWNVLLETLTRGNSPPCADVLDCLPASESGTDYIEKCILEYTASHGLPEYGIQLTPKPGQLMNALLFVTHRRTPARSLAPAMTAVMETFLRVATKSTGDKYQIRYRAAYEQPRVERKGIAYILPSIAVIVFIYIPYQIIGRRMSGRTLAEQISGASPVAMWTATMCTHMVGYFTLGGVYYLITQYHAPLYPKDELTDYILVVVMLYGAVILTMIYCVQRFFRSVLWGSVVIMAAIFFSVYFANLDDGHTSPGMARDLGIVLLPGSFFQCYIVQFDHNYYADRYCPDQITRLCANDTQFQHECCNDALANIEDDLIIYVWIGLAHLAIWTCLLYLCEYHITSKVFQYVFYRLTFSSYNTAMSGLAPPVSVPSIYNYKRGLANIPLSISQIVSAGSFFKRTKMAESSKVNLSPLTFSHGKSFSSSKWVDTGRVESIRTTEFFERTEPLSPTNVGPTHVSTISESSIDRKGVKFIQAEEVPSAEEVKEKQTNGIKESKQDQDLNEGALVIRNLSKPPLFRDVSLGVVAGEVFCFVCSDNEVDAEILRCIVGKSQYTEGQILFQGMPFGWRHPMSPITVGYCSQKEAFSHTLTTKETLTLHCALRGVIDVDEEVNTILKVFKLTMVADMMPKRLSEGTRARIKVAIAMVGEPDIILLDRPLSNVDSIGKVTVFQAINRAKKRGNMVIMTSNSIDECGSLASRVAIIVKGSVMFVSTVKGIRSRFSNSYSLTAKLGTFDDQLVNILVSSLTQRFPDSQVFVDRLNLLHVLLPFRTESLADIFRLMTSVKRHLQVTDFTLSHTTMDRVIDALETDVEPKHELPSSPESTDLGSCCSLEH